MNEISILALGDNSIQAEIKYILAELNVDFKEVSNGLQAVREVTSLSPRLVILDDALSYLNGYQFCRLIKYGLRLGTPLVLLISSFQKMDQFWGTSCGADYCLPKPINTHELKNIITELLLNKKAKRFFFQSSIIGRHTSDLDILKLANDLMDRHLFQEKLLNELRSMNRQVESVRELISVMMSIIGSLFSYRSAAVFISYETKTDLLVSLMQETSQSRLDSLYTSLLCYIKKEEGLDLSLDDVPLIILGPVNQVNQVAETKGDEPDQEEISIFFGEGLRSILCYIAFDGLNIETFPEQEARIFNLILRQAMETMEEKITFEKSIPFSIIDTIHRESSNRSFFLKLLTQNMEQARRFQAPLSLVVLDLENYHQVTESLGKKKEFHFRRKVHQSLLNAIRKMDLIARIGENRFSLVLFRANEEQARCVYHRVKILLEELSPPHILLKIKGGVLPYQPSFGIDADGFLTTSCSRIFQSLESSSPIEICSKPQSFDLINDLINSPQEESLAVIKAHHVQE